MVGLNSGNVITYIKSKNNLEEYITKTYDIQEYSIKNTQYVKNVPGKYVYSVDIDGQDVSFVPVTKDVFKDANKEDRFSMLLHKLEQETTDKIQEILSKYSIIYNTEVGYVLEYNKVSINPDTIVLYLQYNSNDEEQDLEKLYYELASAIKELQNVKQAQKIIITVDEKTLQLSYENLEGLTPAYIRGGLEIEEIIE